MVPLTFDELYIRLANEIENFNRRVNLALNATEYREIANFGVYDAFEHVLNAFETLSDYYNTLNETERYEFKIFEKFKAASRNIQLMGERIKAVTLPKINKIKTALYQNQDKVTTGTDIDDFFPAAPALPPIENPAPNNTFAPVQPIAPAQQLAGNSYLSLLTIPNLLLLICVGLVLRGLMKSTPMHYAVKTLFGNKKKEKVDSPEAKPLSDPDAHLQMARFI